MHFGLPEILIIAVVLLLVVGPSKIPQLGDAIGRGIRNFKKSSTEDDAIDVTPKKGAPEQIPSSQTAARPGASADNKKKS